jgi:hypothetical protein
MRKVMFAVVAGVILLRAGSPAAGPRNDDQSPASSGERTFRSVWVAGFVTAERPDFDVNGEVVREIRSALRSQSTARIVDVAPLGLREGEELVRRDRYAVTVEEHAYPLVVTGTVSFNYPVERRRTHRPGRHVDTHPMVTLKIRLVFIDSASGTRLAEATLPSQRLTVSHGQPGVEAAFSKLFSKSKPALIESILRGTGGGVRWGLR